MGDQVNKMLEWENFGDVNFFEYGGVMVKKDPDLSDSYNFFALFTVENKKFAFSGTVCDLHDFIKEDVIKDLAADIGAPSPEFLINGNPKLCVSELVPNYGCGPFEFSPSNCRGQGQYSMQWEDFQVNDGELVDFMSELDIPAEYIPDLEYEATARYGDRGIESTIKSNNWDEITTFAHEKLSDGMPTEIIDNDNGSRITIDPDVYAKVFDGEFPLNPSYRLDEQPLGETDDGISI